MFHEMSFRFYMKDKKNIETPGIDWSGKMTFVHKAGKYQVWHKSSGLCWNGVGCDRISAPAFYTIVEIKGDRATQVKEVEPGRQWRKVRTEMIAEANRLAGK